MCAAFRWGPVCHHTHWNILFQKFGVCVLICVHYLITFSLGLSKFTSEEVHAIELLDLAFDYASMGLQTQNVFLCTVILTAHNIWIACKGF